MLLMSSSFFNITILKFCIESNYFLQIDVTIGFVRWSHLYQFYSKDLDLGAHLRKAPRLRYNVLHPRRNYDNNEKFSL